jgi:hypothetical protein
VLQPRSTVAPLAQPNAPGRFLRQSWFVAGVATVAVCAGAAAGLAVGGVHPSVATFMCAAAAWTLLVFQLGTVAAAATLVTLSLPALEVGWFGAWGNTVGLFTLLLALLAVTVVAAAPQSLVTVCRTRETWLLVSFALVIGASLFLAPRGAISVSLAKTYFARALILPLVLAAALMATGRRRSWRLAHVLGSILVALGVAGSLLAIVQIAWQRLYLVPPGEQTLFVQQFVGIRAIGLSEAPGTWAAFLMLPVGICAIRVVHHRSGRYAAALFLLLIGLDLSGLRSGWIAEALVLAVVGATVRGPILARAAVIVVALAAAVTSYQFSTFRAFLGGQGSAQVLQARHQRHSGSGKRSGTPAVTPPEVHFGSGRLGVDESAAFRIVITKAELALGARHPFTGVGLGNIGPALTQLPKSYVDPSKGLVAGVPVEKHNVYAGLFAELGAPGAVLFVALLAASAQTLWRLRRMTGGEDRATVEGLLAALIGTAILAGFTEADRQAFLWWILGATIGLWTVTRYAVEPKK